MPGFGTKESVVPLLPGLPGLRTKNNAIAGRYRVEKLLGTGSSGYVIAARHVVLRHRVALKILASINQAHSTAQRRHLRAAHLAANLSGEHVARIVDTGFSEDGLAFIATEWLEGRSLAEELAARRKLPPGEAVGWILQACEGLAEAHSVGLVHADLKPQNLFLAARDDAAVADAGARGPLATRTLKILDFGTPMALAEDGEGGAEGSAAWFASPAYLAPEQLRDPDVVDARADIWALGVILHQLIAGVLPFSSDTVSGMFVAVAYDEPALLVTEGVSFDLARVVKACLAKDPAARPADVAVLARALAPFAGSMGAALAARVDAALVAPPQGARTIELSAAERRADAKLADVRPPERAPRRSARSRWRGSRRSRGALALALAGCGLAGIGVLASSPSRIPPTEVHGEPPAVAPTADFVPLPFVPPASGEPGEKVGAESHREDASGAAPVAALPPEDEPSASERKKLVAHPAAARASSRSPRSVERAATARPHPAGAPAGQKALLSVRKDPYTTGFTHPQRLNDRRRHK